MHFLAHWQKSTVNGLRNLGNYVGTVTARQMTGTSNNLAYDPSAHGTWSAAGVARCVKL